LKPGYFKPANLFLWGILFIVSFLSCSEKPPVPEKKLIKIYVDMLVAQDTISNKAVSIDSLRTIILKKYDLSGKSYRESIQYYSKDPEKWNRFFDKAIEYVEELKAKVSD